MSDVFSTLRRRIARAPTGPGVYRWMNENGDVLYVGKAKNLRARLRSYVAAPDKQLGPWKLSLRAQLRDFNVTVTNSEMEALVLETNLIKELRPKYNVLMKDDKHYVYVEITHKDPCPSVSIVRSMRFASAKYFGPFLRTDDTRRTLDMLHDIFAFRACKASISRCNAAGGVLSTGTACLDQHIGRCNGLCAGLITPEEYRRRIEQVMAFFRGDIAPTIEEARLRMQQAAAEKKFERAARLRDMVQSATAMQERQIVSDTSGQDADVFGVALLSQKAQVVLLRKRDGKLIGEEQFSLAGRAESIADVLSQFLLQYYDAAPDVPPRIVVGQEFDDRTAAAAYLSQKRGSNVEILVPERGRSVRLLELAEKNAQEKAKQIEAVWEAEQRNTEEALAELAALLSLDAPPQRIEGYDISHTGGSDTVGSMVVFVGGKPRNDHYRSFTIHSMQHGDIDDYRALQEVLSRRLRHITGSLAAEQSKWKEGGVVIGKARKSDEETILSILERHPGILSTTDVSYTQYVVARAEEEIIGFVRLREHPGKLRELGSLWVDERYRGGRLGQFLVRTLLRGIKKGKVYLRTFPELEPYYAAVGFRHVHTPPAVFAEALRKGKESDPSFRERVVLAYDAARQKPDVSLSTLPDLLVIDGGKGQLNAVRTVLTSANVSIPVIGLAKREEEVFVPGKSQSLVIAAESPARFLLMRLRDEAHRFANRHRGSRAAYRLVQSSLDRVPGIGPAARKQLLRKLGSVDAVRRAPDAVLLSILTPKQVESLRSFL